MAAGGTAAQSAGRGRWRPVLLSALVFPGAGQLVLRRWTRAALFGLGTTVLVVVFVMRVVAETRARLPTDPDELLGLLTDDPGWPLHLAQAIEHDNAGFFAAGTAALVVLWLLSIADAWRATRPPVGGPVEGPPPRA